MNVLLVKYVCCYLYSVISTVYSSKAAHGALFCKVKTIQ